MKTVSASVNPYSEITSEIEQFIKSKREKPTTIKGTVMKTEPCNNILTIRLEPGKETIPSRGAIILIKENVPLSNNTKPVKIKATVKDSYKSEIKIEIDTDPLMFEDKKIIIDTNTINVILERLNRIVEDITNDEINSDQKRTLDFITGRKQPQYRKEKIVFTSDQLNKEQKKAVTASVEANDFHLIIGPPGTGKTYVIEELIRQFSKRKQKLLITAWTNIAVDNILKKLSGVKSKKIVRIGPINSIDPKVKKYSIFEKMKNHPYWGKIEELKKSLNKLFESTQKLTDEMQSTQKNIDQIKDKVNNSKEKLDNLIEEKQQYRKKEAVFITNLTFINSENLLEMSGIDNGLNLLNRKSQDCLNLSKNILEMNDLKSKIPKPNDIQLLKKTISSQKTRILLKTIPSFFSKKQKQELEQLTIEFGKNKEHLDKIEGFQKKYFHLKITCEKQFNEIYPDKNGCPDKDALISEFKICEMLTKQYIPILKKQSTSNTRKKISEINLEVYKVYLESLERKTDLLNIKISNLKTDMAIQINHKNNLHGQRENLFFSLNHYKGKVNELTQKIAFEIVNEADLIIATAISSNHRFLNQINFDVMIMDESSQVASFMSLLPLLKSRKFVLVGDNRQLQPIEEKNISPEMNLSIFNRLLEMYPHASTLLSTQYRMHKSIAEIASKLFYEGQLKTSGKIAERILDLKPNKNHVLNPKLPVIFIDTSNTDYYEDEVGFGCSNTKEAQYVASIALLFVKNKIKPEHIGIVTPYVKQKELIKKFLKDAKIENLEVNTVHKFQGREKDVMILSFSRSKKYVFSESKLKFIGNKTLINVGITRAKKKLIIVGNSNTLRKNALLNELLDTVGGKNNVVL